MLGVRLKPDEERALERHARAIGKPKSVIVREWIKERLERDSVDARIARAAQIIAASSTKEDRDRAVRETDEFLRMLDREDGGFDWGPKGPPA